MAILTRTTQTAHFVSTADPSVVRPEPLPSPWPTPDEAWLPAQGQPADATRFEVRALSPAEFEAAMTANGEERLQAAYVGLVSLDGTAPPAFAELAFGWAQHIGNLIIGLTLLPMTGLPSRSPAGQLQG
jgi:hypothetical protein